MSGTEYERTEHKYRNYNGQHDTYWRVLPRTDDPAECVEYLLAWWRSKRACEAALYAGKPERSPCEPFDWPTVEALLTAEEEAIETLLDALAGTEPVLRSWEIRDSLYDLVTHAQEGEEFLDTENIDRFAALKVAESALRGELSDGPREARDVPVRPDIS